MNKLLLGNGIISVDKKKLEEFFQKANIRDKKVLLISAYPRDMNHSLGYFLNKKLALDIPDRNFKAYVKKDWEYGIVLSTIIWHCYTNYPCVFYLILGHEIGHLKIDIMDSKLSIIGVLISQFIKDASNRTISTSSQIPIEVECELFGINLALKEFDKNELDFELNEAVREDLINKEYHSCPK